MEKKDYYYLREIIFGLKDEYLKHKNQMELLNHLVSVEDTKNKLKNFEFFIIQCKSLDPELFCSFVLKLNILQQLVYHFGKKNERNDLGKGFSRCNFDDKNDLRLNYCGITLIGQSEEFKAKINEIFNSPFVQNININGMSDVLTIASLLGLSLWHTGIEFSTTEGKYLNYFLEANKHIIEIRKDKSNLTSNDLMYMLNTKFPKGEFSEYHREIIESNPDSTKEVEIIDGPLLSENGYAELELLEKGILTKKLVLAKRRK